MKQQNHKTKRGLLQFVATNYNVNNRGISDRGRCAYQGSKGRCCAIGVQIDLNLRVELDLIGGINDGAFDLLPQRLQSMGYQFLNDIQSLHDIFCNLPAVDSPVSVQLQAN